jgi:hypothetical protein
MVIATFLRSPAAVAIITYETRRHNQHIVESQHSGLSLCFSISAIARFFSPRAQLFWVGHNLQLISILTLPRRVFPFTSATWPSRSLLLFFVGLWLDKLFEFTARDFPELTLFRTLLSLFCVFKLRRKKNIFTSRLRSTFSYLRGLFITAPRLDRVEFFEPLRTEKLV